MKYEKKMETGTETKRTGTGRKTGTGRRGTGRTGGSRRAAALAAAVLLAVAGAAVYAEDGLAVTGSLNTGLKIAREGAGISDFSTLLTGEGTPGRAQFTFAVTKGTLEAKLLLRAANLSTVEIPWAFGVGRFWDDQIVVSIGKIDGNTWGGGGTVGAGYDSGSIARFEFKPSVVPGLSFGFFLPEGKAAEPVVAEWEYKPAINNAADYYDGIADRKKPTDPPSSPDDKIAGTGYTSLDPDGTYDSTKHNRDAGWYAKFSGGNPGYSVADYFSELGFGVTYALADTIDVRLGLKLDGPDGKWDETKQTLTDDEEGVKFFWGVGPTIIGTFVPGLTVWVDGEIRGIGGKPELFYTKGNGKPESGSYTTSTGLKLAYTIGGFSATVNTALETWKDWGLGIAVKPSASYQIFSWLKAGADVELYFKSYENTQKPLGPLGKDAASFDKLFFKFYTSLPLANGFTISPSFSLTSHQAYGTFGTPDFSKSSDETRNDIAVNIGLAYSF